MESRANPLPQLLHTPAGLALLELQGTINMPGQNLENGAVNGTADDSGTTIGRLTFPDYNTLTADAGSTAWMKRVYLYVGQHQRLHGEVKKLPKAIAIIRRRQSEEGSANDKEMPEELEIMVIVKYKILFSHRPEPVGNSHEAT